MARTITQKIALIALISCLTGGGAFARQNAPAESSEVVSYDELNTPEAPDIIFPTSISRPTIATITKPLSRSRARMLSAQPNPLWQS
jgi:hypothetical protein